MKNIKIPLANVIALISASVFSFISFLSLSFFWKGELQESVIAAIAIGVFLLILVFILKKIKSSRRNFQRNAIFELVTLAIYILVAIILSIIPFSHYFTVKDRKEDIKQKIVSDIDSTKEMFSQYEIYANRRILLYEGQLNTAISGRELNIQAFLAMGFNNTESIQTQKNRLLRIFEDDLMPAQYDTTKLYAIKMLDDSKTIITDWILPTSLMNEISTIMAEANIWLTTLEGYANRTLKAETVESFNFQISFTSVEKELTQRAPPSLTAIISAIILHIMILLPYFVSYRNGRHPGLWNALFENENDIKEIGKTL